MNKRQKLKTKLRKEVSVQFSGNIEFEFIEKLFEKHYYVLEEKWLDGDAPKQYIKVYRYEKGKAFGSKLKNWVGYYAKFGGKSYPHESVLEYTINKIGDALGIKMNETKLVIANGQIRFLSKDFLKKGKKLIHAIELLAEYIEDRELVTLVNKDRKNRREYMTFELFEDAINSVCHRNKKDILKSLIQLITYDAIVGNNDRHFYNWGLIGDTKKSQNDPPIFSPIYDTARALLWNTVESKVIEMYKEHLSGSDKIDKYILKTLPRLSFNDKPNANHFELLSFLSQRNEWYKEIIYSLINKEKENIVMETFEKCYFKFYNFERSELMKIILQKRFAKLREVC